MHSFYRFRTSLKRLFRGNQVIPAGAGSANQGATGTSGTPQSGTKNIRVKVIGVIGITKYKAVVIDFHIKLWVGKSSKHVQSLTKDSLPIRNYLCLIDKAARVH